MDQKRRMVTYKDAGVNIDMAEKSLRTVKGKLASTFSKRVLSGIGNFGSLFSMKDLGGGDPVLGASADGVGTKLKLAFMTGVHNTVGVDLVNHCVNDIIVQGADPLFFLDYLAVGKLQPGVFEAVMDGLVTGCRENGLALVGGETAEMPDFYREDEYDLAGFIVGVAGKDRIVDGRSIRKGDRLVGLASSGLHTNGYSLVRKVLFDRENMSLDAKPKELDRTVGEELLEPHMSYRKAVQAVAERFPVKAMVHVTGGGFLDNIPRVLPGGYSARIDLGSWNVPGIFRLIVALAGLDSQEAFRTFNMGIGFIFILGEDDAAASLPLLEEAGFTPFLIGEIDRGGEGVHLHGV